MALHDSEVRQQKMWESLLPTLKLMVKFCHTRCRPREAGGVTGHRPQRVQGGGRLEGLQREAV
jgi:hypothetical protein